MRIKEIIESRNCGSFYIKSVNNFQFELSEVLSNLGLVSKPEYLEECDFSYALEVVKTILWKDLAYSTELISESEALTKEKYLVSYFQDDETIFYTNGNWKDYHIESEGSWSPLTSSTFDGGVILINKRSSTCIWAEDED